MNTTRNTVSVVLRAPRSKADHPSFLIRWAKGKPVPQVVADLAAAGWKPDGFLVAPPPAGLMECAVFPRPGSLLFGRLTDDEALTALEAARAVLMRHGIVSG